MGSLPIVLAVIAVAALVGVVVWYSLQQVRAGDGEETLDVPIICAACGHAFSVTFDGLAELTAQAHAAGHASAGRDMESALGLCPGCGRYAVYRAEEDAQTGKPVPPPFATAGGTDAISPMPETTDRSEPEGKSHE